MGLRIYTVHLPTSSLREVIARAVPQLVKEGFSWPAFFLGVIWALWHRLWIEAAALIALFLAVGIILDFIQPSESIQVVVMIAIAVLIGASGNNWRRESLRRRGFLDAGVVVGPDRENALCRYLDLRSLATPEQRAFSANARFGLPASASLAMAPQTADQFASMVLGESGSGDRREFAVDPRFDGREAQARAATDDNSRSSDGPDNAPNKPSDNGSPGRGSPGTGYGLAAAAAAGIGMLALDPTALRASAPEDRAAMNAQPPAENCDPPVHAEPSASGPDIGRASDTSGAGTQGTGYDG